MSNLTGLNLDPNVDENAGSFTVLPAGKYRACVVADELKDNRAGTGKILALKVQVIDGQFAQEILTDNINITNPSAQCQAIGQGTLKRICNICSVQYPPTDTKGIMGKPMVIDVGVEKFISNTSGKELNSNKIKSYNPPNTPIPAIAPQQSSATQPQAQPQAASGW